MTEILSSVSPPKDVAKSPPDAAQDHGPEFEGSAQPSAEELEIARELVRSARARGVALTGPDGMLKALTKTVIETALDEEMSEHLGYRSLTYADSRTWVKAVEDAGWDQKVTDRLRSFAATNATADLELPATWAVLHQVTPATAAVAMTFLTCVFPRVRRTDLPLCGHADDRRCGLPVSARPIAAPSVRDVGYQSIIAW